MKNRLTYFVKYGRPVLALALAYACALQVILAGVVASGMAAVPPADAAVICYSSPDETGHQPAHSPAHLADCMLSCAQGFGAAAILPDVATTFIRVPGTAIEPVRAATLTLPPRPSPKLSQGPPSNT
jgi:hypothetical protein